jgi:hypothetical protein
MTNDERDPITEIGLSLRGDALTTAQLFADRLGKQANVLLSQESYPSDFGFRTSRFFRPSDFGFRVF